MSGALHRLREKIHKSSQELENRYDSTGDHTNTMNFTDRTILMERVHKNGSKPQDWLELIKSMKDSPHYANDKTRQIYMSDMFAKAIKSIADNDKKSEPYARLMIQYALFRGQFSKDDAREVYQDLRYDAKRCAIAHTAAAQFELDCGNRNKAMKILEKAQQLQAQPTALIKIAFTNLIYGKTVLVSEKEEEEFQELGKENMADVSGSVVGKMQSSDTGSLVQRLEQHHTAPSLTAPTVEHACSKLQENACHTDQHSSFNTSGFERLHTSPVKSRDVLHSLDDNNGCKTKSSTSDDSQLDGADTHHTRSMRSYHSTPDCKHSSLLSTSNKKSSTKELFGRLNRDVGKPMRVPCRKRIPLPQVFEQQGEDAADDSFKLEPLRTDPMTTTHDASHHDMHVRHDRLGSDSGILSNATSSSSGLASDLSYASPDVIGQEPDGVDSSAQLQVSSSTLLGSVSSARSTSQLTAVSKTLEHSHNKQIKVNTLQVKCAESVSSASSQSANSAPSQSANSASSQCVSSASSQADGDNVNPVSFSRDIHGATQAKDELLSSRRGLCIRSSQPTNTEAAPTKRAQGALVQASSLAPCAIPAPASQKPVVFAPPLPTPANPIPAVLPPPAQTPAVSAPPQPAVSADKVITIKGKNYTKLGIIGRGGTSKVYTVMDPNGQLLAVKRIDLTGADDFTIEGYRNEIDLLQRLQYSKSVIKLYDSEYCEETRRLYLLMEKGETDLSTYFKSCSESGEMTLDMIIFFWNQMLTAVQALHKEGIVHSDLKPANFVLVSGRLKLIDFGIAKAIGDHTSATRDYQIGTLNYMSPEALQDACAGMQLDEHGRVKPKFKIGVKSDVWSLGCILYNLVYGKTPFQHIRPQMKLHAITNPNVVIDFPPHKHQPLVDVLKRCLQRDPKKRPSIEEARITISQLG